MDKKQKKDTQIQEQQQQENIEDIMELENDQNDNDNINKQDDEVVKEIEVIYVPIDYQVFITQYPLRSKFNDEFENFLKPVNCEYKPKQKKLNINFCKTDEFTNLKMDLTQQNTDQQDLGADSLFIGGENETQNILQQKLLQQQKQNEEENQQNYQVSYTSKLINNKLTYFVSHYDKVSNKIYLFPIDSFMQMRPIIKQKESKATKNTPTDIKRISREIERDKNLLQKHPDKYVENRLRYHNTFNEIYNSENFVPYKYKDISQQQQQRSQSAQDPKSKKQQQQQYIPYNPLTHKFPENIIDLKYSSKETFVNKLEGNPLKRQQIQQKQ